jgi:hypothetical protein
MKVTVRRLSSTVLGLLFLVACGPTAAPQAATEAGPQSAQASATPCVPAETGGCLEVAPEAQRVDLSVPTFSDPTNVTNPLHPSSALHSAVMLGQSDGLPFRVEVTLLPATKPIEWGGQTVQALESQYVAFVDGRIQEVALDWYAQADDGSVWYLGEDVFNYEDGVVADLNGTWLAGRDGPGAMIMPADPQVGDVYRPENVPGIVFEEVTVRETGQTVDGPSGPVAGAIQVEELHMDGAHEDKTFAPGYGEFSTGSGANLEALALAVPTDALAEPLPPELAAMAQAATEIDDALIAGDWEAATGALATLNSNWDSYRSGVRPPLLVARTEEILASLTSAVESRATEAARQAALHAAVATLDFQLRHRAPAEIDLARFAIWLRQLRLDTAAEDSAGVAGDTAALEWTRDRLTTAWDETTAAEVDQLLTDLRSAADAEDLPAAAEAADRLTDLLAG